jgi:signal transduction histidine kinase
MDLGKIRRVIANLISNSLKYTGNPLKKNMSSSVSGGFAAFTIEDNGVGFPQMILATYLIVLPRRKSVHREPEVPDLFGDLQKYH